MDPEWATRVDLRLIALETRAAVDDVHRENVAVRLGHIDDTLKWLVRLVIGGLLMSALAFVLRGGLQL
ncbi:pseudouridine synthase [Yoonia sp.]|uniref:pseudouridine synthase n=1 Tax=Yoonia sp. TaxID=2212373 RepID=UPI002384988D|nr:pseudouridine synthase [Yoonia sp.]MDE0851709.1 pseudouridine synthase [Yoonia sp.]